MKGETLGMVLLLALAFGLHGDTPPSPRPRPGPGPGPGPKPNGNERPKTATWAGGDANAWIVDRYHMARELLSAQLPDQYDADDVAASVVAHWGIETAWGANEFNYNLGGIHASSGEPFFRAMDAGQPTRFVAYDSLQAAAKAYASLLMQRYRACGMALLEDPEAPDWYVCLGSKGYYAPNPNAAAIITSARARVTAALKGGGA